MTLREQWDQFWFHERSTRPLCLLRIAFGLVFVLHCVMYGGIHNVSNMRFYFPRAHFDKPSKYFLDGYRLPVPGWDWLPVPTFSQFYVIDVALLVLGVLFTLGLAFRIVGPALALLYAYVFLLSQFFYHHHAMLLVLTLLVLGFSPAAQRYSLDAWLFSRGKARPDRSVLPIRLLQVTVSVLYFFSFAAKLNEGWWTGQIIRVFDESGAISRDFGPWVLERFSPPFLSRFTLLAEGFLVLGLWLPRVRWAAIALGVALHLGIDMLMAVRTFSLQMLALYILFMIPAQRDRPASGKDLASE